MKTTRILPHRATAGSFGSGHSADTAGSANSADTADPANPANGGARERFPAFGLAAALALCLAACDGPWNMEPETGPRPDRLWVSALLIADRPADTLWIERPYALDEVRDSSVAFVDAASSSVAVIDAQAGDTIRYALSPERAAAWIPVDTSIRIRKGADYELRADITWKTNGGSGAARRDILTARTRVPAKYALGPTAEVPMEALHPVLAAGLPPSSAARARADAAYRALLFDSLNALPGVAPLTGHGLGVDDFAAYLEGRSVYRPVPRNGSIHYIFDPVMVTDYSGAKTHRYSLPWLFSQEVDGDEFGGIILSQRFDSTRARIYDPLQRRFDETFGEDLDSAEFYQRGQVRNMLVAGDFYPGVKEYPDTLRLTNLLWGYTGRNVLYAYGVDPLYYEYYKGMIATGQDAGTGLGGGNPRPQNVLRFSNVGNGDGFFSAAVLDSFAIDLIAVKDTIPVAALRAAWLADRED